LRGPPPVANVKNLEDDEEVKLKLEEERLKKEKENYVETDVSKMSCWGKIQN
jgi:uncharacterized protein (UPF0212 family)